MNRTIKSKIILSNIIVVIASLIIILMMLLTSYIKNSFADRLDAVKNIQISWINIERNMYLSMNRWLNGSPYEAVIENINEIDQLISNIHKKSNSSILVPAILKKEVNFMNDLWEHSKKDYINPIVKNMDNFVVSRAFLEIETESAKRAISINEQNYYTNLNLKSLVYSRYELINDKEKSRYVQQGMRLFEQIDRFYSSSDSYAKKVNNVLSLSLKYSNIANIISTIVMILLIILQIIAGIILSINNGNRISKPILVAANKLFDFVGDSLERRTKGRTDDEISLLNNYVELLLGYYKELSSIAKKLSIGDTTVNITPKSENDVMGNAFMGISEYLTTLTDGANQIINGNYNNKIEERSDKDILARTYNKLSTSIIELLDKTREMTRLESEIQAAAKIQSSVLPRHDENLEGYSIAHTSIAAAEVGGDNYDFRTTKNGNWISIGDVSGHGLEAGILALISQSAFNYGAYMFEHEKREDPQVLMYEYVNKTLVLLSNIRSGSCSFMTQNYFFENNGTFYCAGAHEIGLLYRKSEKKVIELKELSGSIPFMGIIGEVNAIKSKFTFNMESGDTLVLYSDGLIEAKNGNGEQFDVDNLKKALEETADNDVETIKQLIIEKLTKYCENGDLKKYNGSFADDVTLLVLRRK